jgi:adenylate kinase
VNRGYNDKKRSENMECEIMQVVAESARESYPPEAVHELSSNTVEDMDSNVDRIVAWLDAWKQNNTK